MAGIINPPSSATANQPYIVVANKVFTDLTNLKQLHFAVGGANGWCTAREWDGSAGYTPSGSNKFRIHAVKIRIFTAGVLYYQQTDNDSGVSTTTAATNPVYNGGDIDLSYITFGGSFAAGQQYEFLLDFQVANGKYLTLTNDGTAVIMGTVYGYEEP